MARPSLLLPNAPRRKRNQIYVLSNSGGEARALTNHASAVSNITWSPDGSLIYFRAPDPKTEQQKARDKLKDDVFLFDEDYQQQHLWSISVSSRAEHRITDGKYSVTSYQLSRDGRKIAFHRAPTPLLEDMDQSEVWVMDADGGGGRQITRNKVAEGGAEVSPDGNRRFSSPRRPTRSSKLITTARSSSRPRVAARRGS